jgi:hypothetical protein
MLSIFAVKYLYKYVYKGPDHATAIVERRVDMPNQENNAQAVVANGEWQNRDEIKAYLEGRYVSTFEASWRLFSFRMHDMTPLSHALPWTSLECIQSCTMIMLVFLKLLIASKTIKQHSLNTSKPILITPWPEKSCTWIYPPCLHGPMGRKKWTIQHRGCCVGRLYFVSPSVGEQYILRTLLTKVKGVISFEALRTVDGVVHDTFKSACIALGLYDLDDEWNACLEEAVGM